jgi:hypothetical protein
MITKRTDNIFIIFMNAFFALTIIFLVTSCEKENEVSTNYKNHEKDFSIVFPEGWEVQETKMEIDAIALSALENSKDNFRENISVTAVEQKYFLTGKEILDGYAFRLKVLITDFEIIEEGEAKIGPVKSPWIKYIHRQGIYELVVKLYAVPGKKFGYLIFCTADKSSVEKYDQDFNKSAESFRVVP